MSNIDRPLRTMLSEDLRIVSSSLQSAIADAKFCGLHATADKLEELRKPIVDEYNNPVRWPESRTHSRYRQYFPKG